MFWTGGRFWEVVAIEGLTLLKRENWSRVGVICDQASEFFFFTKDMVGRA